MRLTCPNCGAQYEVPDDVIPPGGRDVQCSNCGDTWYEGGAAAQPEPSAFEDFPEPSSSGAAEPEPAAEAEPEPEPEPAPRHETPARQPSAEAAGSAPEEPEEPQPPREKRKQRLAPDLAGILREEAAREAELRDAEQSGLESQPEFGLQEPEQDEAERRARQSRDRMARLRGENPAALEAEETGSRRGLLPDIEEINSTLRANSEAVPGPVADVSSVRAGRSGGGFRAGFLLTLILAIVLGGIYAKAPEIAKAVPQTDPAVSSYVALVDQARVWLDAQVRSVAAN
jgi:predicted Zn finger-like uncharacterized protein